LGRVLHNSGWLVAERLVRVLTGIVVNVWVARLLGPAEFGSLAYVLAFLAFFQAATPLGLDAILVREIKRARHDAPTLLGTVLAGRLLAGGIAWCIAVALAMVSADTESRMPWFIALAGLAMLFQAVDVVDLWFQSQTRSRDTVAPKLVAFVLVTGTKVFLLFSDAPLEWFVGMVAVEAIAIAGALWVAGKRYGAQLRWSVHWPLLRDLMTESWPLLVSSIAVIAYMRADQLLIRELLGERPLGVYAAALTISQALHFVPALIAVSLAPFVVHDVDGESSEASLRFVWIFRVYFYAGALLAACVALLATPLVAVLYGPMFSEAAAVLRIHVFTNAFIFVGVAHSLWLTYKRATAVRLAGTLLAAGLAMAGNALALPHYGLVAAAMIAVMAQFVAAIGVNALLSRDSFRLQLEAILFIRVCSNLPRTDR
jgi:PST family polysaccharide transporter